MDSGVDTVTASAEPEDPMIGTVLDGRLEIQSRLGSGGMGHVYRARQRPLGRDVAVKVMRPERKDAADMRRFEREIQALGRLAHPNVVTILDSGQTADGLLWLAMELVDGRTVAEVLRDDGPMPPRRALRVALGVCEALAAAHACGLVHRDLKPANVMLCSGDGGDRVKVLDFGLARPALDDAGLTSTGAVVGTPLYLAPEVVAGLEADARSDVYGVGILLHEMLTGAPQGRGSLRGKVPAIVENLVARLAAVDASQRLVDGAAAREAVLAGMEQLGQASKPPSRAHSMAIAAAIAVTAAIAGGTGVWVARSSSPKAEAAVAPSPAPSGGVVINGQPADPRELAAYEERYSTKVPPRRYWYDPRSGLWGLESGPAVAATQPDLHLGAPLRADASNGDSGVFLNGRQLHINDIVAYQYFFALKLEPGRYLLDGGGLRREASGEVIDFVTRIQGLKLPRPNQAPLGSDLLLLP